MSGRLFVFVAVIIVTAFLAGCVQPKAETEVPIGVLVDLSGPLTTYGEDIRTTVTIASERINKYFEDEGKPYTLTSIAIAHYGEAIPIMQRALHRVQDQELLTVLIRARDNPQAYAFPLMYSMEQFSRFTLDDFVSLSTSFNHIPKE